MYETSLSLITPHKGGSVSVKFRCKDTTFSEEQRTKLEEFYRKVLKNTNSGTIYHLQGTDEAPSILLKGGRTVMKR